MPATSKSKRKEPPARPPPSPARGHVDSRSYAEVASPVRKQAKPDDKPASKPNQSSDASKPNDVQVEKGQQSTKKKSSGRNIDDPHKELRTKAIIAAAESNVSISAMVDICNNFIVEEYSKHTIGARAGLERRQ